MPVCSCTYLNPEGVEIKCTNECEMEHGYCEECKERVYGNQTEYEGKQHRKWSTEFYETVVKPQMKQWGREARSKYPTEGDQTYLAITGQLRQD